MNTSITVIAIAAALAVLGVVIVLALLAIPVQEAEAGCERGGIRALVHAFNASQGRCFGQGP
jgi:cytochrome c oxidase assembly factor CtaG